MLMSSPAGATLVPGGHGPRRRSTAGAVGRTAPTVRSTITTASAPSGTGAPVMIRIASPGPIDVAATGPARPSATVGTTGTGTRGRRRLDREPVHGGVGERRAPPRRRPPASASTHPTDSSVEQPASGRQRQHLARLRARSASSSRRSTARRRRATRSRCRSGARAHPRMQG